MWGLMSKTKKIRRTARSFILAILTLVILDISGILLHFVAHDYDRYSSSLSRNSQASDYKWDDFTYKVHPTCDAFDQSATITIVVKSAVANFKRRAAIRRSWGNEKRFSDIKVRCFFVVGLTHDNVEARNLRAEAYDFNDLIQPNFIDTYFNNTLKTVLGIRWLIDNCHKSKYFLFVDDDYLVLLKNVLKFIKHVAPGDYKSNKDLYAGYVIQSRPLRDKISKWSISLKEYPYDKWPAYVTAGAYLISRKSLFSLNQAFDKTFFMRFDDIFLSLSALRANLTLTHCKHFHFEPPPYNTISDFKYLIASHGFGNPMKMEKLWNECKSAGYA